jgi:hypothetical protein
VLQRAFSLHGIARATKTLDDVPAKLIITRLVTRFNQGDRTARAVQGGDIWRFHLVNPQQHFEVFRRAQPQAFDCSPIAQGPKYSFAAKPVFRKTDAGQQLVCSAKPVFTQQRSRLSNGCPCFSLSP